MAVAASNVFYSLIFRPAEAMSAVRWKNQVLLALVIVAGALISHQVAITVLASPYPSVALPAVVMLGSLAFKAAVAVILWLALTVMCHGVAQMMGGRGKIGMCFSVLGMSAMPFLFSTPAALLMTVLGAGDSLVYALFVLPLLWIWAVVLAVTGIRQTYEVSGASAFLCVALPPAILAGGGAALSFLGLVHLISIIEGIGELMIAAQM